MEEEMKKKSLRQITYGMYIVTSLIDDVVGAGTVNWLSQSSFNLSFTHQSQNTKKYLSQFDS